MTHSTTDHPGWRGPEDDVRLEDEVALAGEDADVVIAPVGRGDIVMDALRQQFVVVDDHRVLFARLVSGRIEQGALQPPPLVRLVLDELAPAPGEFALEGIGLGRLLGLFQIRAADENIGRDVVVLEDVAVDLGVLGLGQRADAPVEPDEAGDLARRA